MPNTMTLIASSTVGAGGTVSITFSSIPSTYTDLLVKCSLRGNQTSAVYTDVDLLLTGGTFGNAKVLYAISGTNVGSYSPGAASISASTGPTATASTFSNAEIYIPNYIDSNNKSASGDAVGENNGTNTVAILGAAAYSSSGAITELTLRYGTGSIGNFVQYSTAYLYGIVKS